MQSRVIAASALLLSLATSSVALAQFKVDAKVDAKVDSKGGKAKGGVTTGSDGVRRDPKGVKGISPFWEAIKKGDDALAARDVDGAKTQYQEAIKSQPQHPMGHYRLGEVELTKGNFKGAEESWQSALRFVGQDGTMKGKVLFVLADVKERQRSLEEAKNGWNAYEGHSKAATQAKTYPETPPDRVKRIDEWKKLETDYASVKERIALRLAEAEKKAAADAQNPRNK